MVTQLGMRRWPSLTSHVRQEPVGSRHGRELWAGWSGQQNGDHVVVPGNGATLAPSGASGNVWIHPQHSEVISFAGQPVAGVFNPVGTAFQV
jgi:hypothetical protein